MYRRALLAFFVLLTLGACSSAFAVVMLNEFYYDNIGTDDPNILFTELWGTPGTAIGGWTLVGINGNGGTEYLTVTIATGATIPADGYFVIGGANVPNVDQIVTADFQNAGSSSGDDCDGLDLRDADGVTVDHLCYGPCAAGHQCTGEGGGNAPDPFPSTGHEKSIGRVPDHQDTDHNAVDWIVLEPPSPGVSNAGTPCVPQEVNLSQIRENSQTTGLPVLDSIFVVTRGIVNVDNFVFDSLSLTNFYFQDQDAGVNMYRGTPPAGIVAGDCVVVSAWVGAYHGLTEMLANGAGTCLASIQRTAHVAPPTPMLLAGNAFWEAFEGMLVQVNNVHIVSGSWPASGQYGNLTISDGAGTITLRINKWTNIDGSPQPQGNFNVVGVIGQYADPPYTDGYQLMPRSLADINPEAANEPGATNIASEFELAGAYPNPFNSVAQIRYEVGSARELSLHIYDLLGREVLGEKLSGLTPGSHVYTWTPNGSTGLYFVRMDGPTISRTAKLLYLR